MKADKSFVALILEDETLVSLDLEMTFTAAGFEVFTAATCAQAEQWLKSCHPNILIADIILPDGPSDAVVTRMLAVGIPFIVHSGDHPKAHSSDVFARGEWLGKPASADFVVELAMNLLVTRKHGQDRQMEDANDRYERA